MRKAIIIVTVALVAAAGWFWFGRKDGRSAQAGAGMAAEGRGTGGGRGGMGGGLGRPPMTVETAPVSRASVAEEITVVGNLIGMATVDVVPKVSGRLQTVNVRLGDRVARGQVLAQLEDQEIREQVRQAEASFEVARATVRQREADLKLAETNAERSRNLFGRQLIPRQTLDDNEARYQSARAQVDLARAQFEQAKARLEELRITLSNTRIVSPVNGFVGRRELDPGAFASSNAPIASVVDISIVRLVANLVERDLRRVAAGTPARVDVDAYPGEVFAGRVARVAPVLDPATRTAQMEVEIPNPSDRLKPGMYARVALTLELHENALVVPRNALVDVGGTRGVFLLETGEGGPRAKFQGLDVGLQDQDKAEIKSGLSEGQRVITTGAAALRDGDPVVLSGQGGGRAGGRPAGGQPGAPGGGRPPGPPGA